MGGWWGEDGPGQGSGQGGRPTRGYYRGYYMSAPPATDAHSWSKEAFTNNSEVDALHNVFFNIPTRTVLPGIYPQMDNFSTGMNLCSDLFNNNLFQLYTLSYFICYHCTNTSARLI